MLTYDSDGQVEKGRVLFQAKATDKPRWNKDGSALRIAVEKRDLSHWLFEAAPIILVVYDV